MKGNRNFDKNSFRADSRWGGMSTLSVSSFFVFFFYFLFLDLILHIQGTDALVGYNEHGNIYVFDEASNLCPISEQSAGKKRHNTKERVPIKKARVE